MKMSDNKIEVASPEIKPMARLSITKDQAMDLTVGLAVRLEVAGEVKEVSRCYNDPEKYEVVLDDPIVKNVSSGGDTEDETDNLKEENLATVSLGDLKKLISKEEGK
jgi:hypothetical protein